MSRRRRKKKKGTDQVVLINQKDFVVAQLFCDRFGQLFQLIRCDLCLQLNGHADAFQVIIKLVMVAELLNAFQILGRIVLENLEKRPEMRGFLVKRFQSSFFKQESQKGQSIFDN